MNTPAPLLTAREKAMGPITKQLKDLEVAKAAAKAAAAAEQARLSGVESELVKRQGLIGPKLTDRSRLLWKITNLGKHEACLTQKLDRLAIELDKFFSEDVQPGLTPNSETFFRQNADLAHADMLLAEVAKRIEVNRVKLAALDAECVAIAAQHGLSDLLPPELQPAA